MEALLLGGNTACLGQGRLIQFGRTPEVYRRPLDLRAAETFSDPPLNVVGLVMAGAQVRLAGGEPGPAAGLLAGLPDGAYRIGIRAHDLHLAAPGADALTIRGTVDVTEITGSESYIHVHAGDLRWVALAPGVHEIEPGTPIAVHADPARLLVFAEDGHLAAAPADRLAA